MGRPRGSKNKPKTNGDGEAPAAGIGDNSGEMTDEQRYVLTHQHMQRYGSALAAKKKADADLKNVCKVAKADLGKQAVADIKLMVELRSPEGEAALKERMEAQARVARWMGLPLGIQGDLFPGDPRPDDERAFDNGRRTGLQGEPCKPPHDPSVPQHDAWINGWQAGQKVLLETKIRPLTSRPDEGDAENGDDDADVRPRFLQGDASVADLGDAPGTYQQN